MRRSGLAEPVAAGDRVARAEVDLHTAVAAPTVRRRTRRLAPFTATALLTGLLSGWLPGLGIPLHAQSSQVRDTGEDDDSLLEEVRVTGSYLESPRYAIGAVATADEADLAASMRAETEQALARLPGFSVSRAGGPGGASEVFLRGAESNFTTVLLDGLRLNNPANNRGGSYDFSGLAVSEIGRIDVTMGATSALYGSDAMAGIIRIQSALPEPGGAEILAELGTVGDWRWGAAGGVALGRVASLAVRGTAGDGGDEIEGSRLTTRTVSGRLSGEWAMGDGWRVDVRRAEREGTTFPEISGGPELAVNRALEQEQGTDQGLHGQFRFGNGSWLDSELSLGWTEYSEQTSTPAIAAGILPGQPAYTTDSESRRAELSWLNRRVAPKGSEFAYGVGLVQEHGRDDGTVDLGFTVLPNSYRLSRTTVSAFGEFGTRWGEALTANLAARLDHTESTTRLSGKLALSRSFESLAGDLWARVASGFKLPSFFALANPLVGNPELRPEEVTSLEVGWDQRLSTRFTSRLSVFSNRYVNLVDFDFDSFRNVNRAEVDIRGVDARLDWAVSAALRVGVDVTLSDFRSDSGPLRRRPEQTGGLRLTWSPGTALSFDGALRYVGSRLITSIPTGDSVDGGYWLAGVTLAYDLSKSFRLWLAVDNIFDAAYQNAPGFPSPGRRARFGLEFLFGAR